MDFADRETVAQLVQRCIEGDKKSQLLLYKTFYGKMMAVCMRYSGSASEAKDLLHDGFLKVFAHLHGFKNEGSLEGWIRRIVTNTSIDYVRKRKETLLGFDERMPPESAQNKIDNEEADEEEFVHLKAELIMKLIQELSPAYRTVFNMYVLDDYSHKEIAQILGINIGTSKSNLAKAKQKLREFYFKHKNKLDE
jgi:RNA polymerase sigma-70 factor (ECF subfamily)